MSNGSEHLDERCVHVVDGPDWAGLRELNNAEVDYKALIADLTTTLSDAARCHSLNIQPAWYGVERDLGKAVRAIKVLAAERDALQAENVQLRGDLSENRRALDDAINVANGNKIARDALQARLDAMTVEWGVALPGESGFGTPDRATAESFVRDYPEEEYSLVSRLVGPWTVVPEGDTNA